MIVSSVPYRDLKKSLDMKNGLVQFDLTHHKCVTSGRNKPGPDQGFEVNNYSHISF